jgi:prepilin-type N-terminal cleavage/methylation domain-containing protein
MWDRDTTCEDGFTLAEVLVALFLIGIGVLAAAPMFMYAMQGTAVGGDFGSAGAAAVERMELLRAEDYPDLVPGGNIDSNVGGYFDASDPDYLVRWEIEIAPAPAPPGTKTITVRALAARQVVGERKDVVLTTLRGR